MTFSFAALAAAAAATEPAPAGPGIEGLTDLLSWGKIAPFVYALILIAVGGVMLGLLSKWAGRSVAKYWSRGHGAVIRKAILYCGWALLVLAVLGQLGFKLTAVLGAAGVAGLAVGFAAQSSLSNVISGIFLATERPFKAGDMIQVGETLGVVLSIDLLSVKLRTFDNKFVRIPNETLVKTQVTNFSRFPIRRVDLLLGVAYKEDVERVRSLLLEIARDNPLALQEPEPLCFCWNFNTSSVDLLFVVWAAKDDWLTLKDELLRAIKRRFDEEGIEIPFPHVSLYAGEATKPLSVDLAPETLDALRDAGAGRQKKG